MQRAYNKINSKDQKNWCHENFLNSRHLFQVGEIRNQLRDIFNSLNLDLRSSTDTNVIRKERGFKITPRFACDDINDDVISYRLHDIVYIIRSISYGPYDIVDIG